MDGRAGKKFRGLLLAAAVLSVPLIVGVPSASAYVRIDSRCILRAYIPTYDGTGSYWVSGEVDCTAYGNVHSEIQVCSQVYNGSTGLWYTVSGSCRTNSVTANFNYLQVFESGVCGHLYRTWDWGYLYDNGASATYTSDGDFNCS